MGESLVHLFLVLACSMMEDVYGSNRVRIDRKSSIESEPRTLTMDQIQYAREAALYVMNTRSIEEAINIFTEGLEPVVSSVAEDEGKIEYPEPEDGMLLGSLAEIRDIVSAPF